MSHIFIGIYDEDAVYGKRLMEYINRQKEYPLTAAAFASLEALTEFIASQDVKGVILEEGTQINSKVTVPPSEERALKGGMPIWKCKGDREGGICSFQSKRPGIKRCDRCLLSF